MTRKSTYNERYRPQFHFTAKKNWLNDPNGCVFYDGEYHLFFQHNPAGLNWGNMTWGHAVSRDLVHWHQLKDAIGPYNKGTIFSGSAVADSGNRSGLGTGPKGPLVAAFTHARKPFGQAIAFSIDNGRNWQLYAEGKHVVPNQGMDDGERDPKIFWHDLTQQWIMVLWVRLNQVRFFTSDDLLHWDHASDFNGEGFYECPDLFQLPLDRNRQSMKWVLCDATLNYWVGTFNGQRFIPEAGPIKGDYGGNFYAGQTWNNCRNRVVQIAWMHHGEYPGMPFNQQMSFPCELSLRKTDSGFRLFRIPVDEIKSIRVETDSISNHTLHSGEKLSAGRSGDLFDIEAELEPAVDAGLAIRFYDQEITYIAGEIRCMGKAASLLPVDGIVRLRILLDRTSIEIYANDGEVCFSLCFLTAATDTLVEFQAITGAIQIKQLDVHRLASSWMPIPGNPNADDI